MSLLDQVISDAKINNIIKDEIPIVSPSLNPTDKTNYPDSWEKISNREYQDETDFMQKVDFAVDLKKDTSEFIDETVIDQINEAFSPKDLRQAQETGRLIHNWWIYYLKSLKKFINHSFDDSIRNFHYNYANKAIEFGKLYNKPTLENPSCIINLDSFTPDGNIDPIRRNSGFFSILQSLELAINKTNKEVIYCDFKFVNLQQTIMINFNSSTDILNYYDRLTTVYPINHDFESYQFRSLINVHSVTEGWGLDDDIHGIVWDVSALGNDHHAGPNTKDKLVQRWGEYYCTPRFTIQSVNPLIDKQSEKYQLTIGLNTFIRVPQTIFGYYNRYIGIKAIEVIARSLRAACENDPKGREDMALGQYIAGMGFSNVGLGIVHSMAHALGAVYDTPHGVANAILLPTVMAYNADATGTKYKDIAIAMGVEGVEDMTQEEYRKAAVDAVAQLSKDVKIPQDLKDIVKEEDLDFLVDSAYNDACAPGNPKDATKEDIKALYQSLM